MVRLGFRACFATSAIYFLVLLCNVDCRKLLIAHVLWRHGQRTPVRLIPTDTNNSVNTWPQGALGELTAAGMKQEFQLGSQLKARYSALNLNLRAKSIASQIHVRSTNYNRTLMSAYSNFAGAIKPVNLSGSNTIPNIAGWPTNWQPIPVHTVPRSTDYLLHPDTYCPTVDKLYRLHVWNSTQWRNLTNQNREFFRWLGMKAGLLDLNLDNLWQVQDPLFVEKVTPGRHWPSWVSPSVYNKVHDLAQFSDSQLYHDPTIARLRGGSLLKEIIGRMSAKASCLGKTDYNCQWINGVKYYAYSAHDTTVMSLLETLARDNVGVQTGAANLTGGGLPGYCACITVDLFQEDNGQFTVEVHYKNQYGDTTFIPIPLSGANNVCKSGKCSLKNFAARSKPFMPVNYVKGNIINYEYKINIDDSEKPNPTDDKI